MKDFLYLSYLDAVWLLQRQFEATKREKIVGRKKPDHYDRSWSLSQVKEKNTRAVGCLRATSFNFSSSQKKIHFIHDH
jgi:hypothetical protein